MSKLEVDIVAPQSGTSLTVGEAGDTVTVTGLAYPTSDGTNGQALVTNGSGTLSFADISISLSYTSGTATGDNTTTDFTISSGRAVDDVSERVWIIC